MDEGSISNILLTCNVHECADCSMTFDMKLKLFDHMIVHDPDDGDENDDNNKSFSRNLRMTHVIQGPMQTVRKV